MQPEERSLEPFNEYHQLRLRVTFQHIDSLLAEVEHILVDAQSGSPFNRYAGDTTPIQQKIAHDYVVRMRTAMARIMKEQGIAFGDPRATADGQQIPRFFTLRFLSTNCIQIAC
jgi:hypothetical protein